MMTGMAWLLPPVASLSIHDHICDALCGPGAGAAGRPPLENLARLAARDPDACIDTVRELLDRVAARRPTAPGLLHALSAVGREPPLPSPPGPPAPSTTSLTASGPAHPTPGLKRLDQGGGVGARPGTGPPLTLRAGAGSGLATEPDLARHVESGLSTLSLDETVDPVAGSGLSTLSLDELD